jgi:hypothetical protein
MADLTDDEFTCLLIAAGNQQMLEIGRWAQPVRSLKAKGFLTLHGAITPQGREAAETRDQEDNNALVAAFKQSANVCVPAPASNLSERLREEAIRIAGGQINTTHIISLLKEAAARVVE